MPQYAEITQKTPCSVWRDLHTYFWFEDEGRVKPYPKHAKNYMTCILQRHGLLLCKYPLGHLANVILAKVGVDSHNLPVDIFGQFHNRGVLYLLCPSPATLQIL